jgi:hypothetical protein
MRAGIAILILALSASQAGARCHNPRPRLICAEYFQSKAVVIAKLAGVTTVKDDFGDVTGSYYSLTVEQLLRGKVARMFRVYIGNDGGRNTFDWKTGENYVLFLLQQTSNGSWEVDDCGNSGPANGKQSALDQIDMIDPNSSRAMIQGAVGGVSFAFPLDGVQVEATGPGGVVTTATNAVGKFELRVAPGKYQVRALLHGKAFVADEFTYENPENLVLENGGCAQVQFVEAKQTH